MQAGPLAHRRQDDVHGQLLRTSGCYLQSDRVQQQQPGRTRTSWPPPGTRLQGERGEAGVRRRGLRGWAEAACHSWQRQLWG